MAYHDRQIPSRPAPTAPPPPRRLEAPRPEHTIPKADRNRPTRKSIKRSQLIAIIIMIILVVFFFIIYYLATVLITNEYSGEIDKDAESYTFRFTIPDIMSQDVQARIEIDANERVEFYILHDRDYKEDMNISDIRINSINHNNKETSHFVYEDKFEEGEYVIISYVKDNKNDITINYEITRYIVMPVLWLISLIFVILILLCVVRLFLLERKKKLILPPGYADYDYGYDRSAPYHEPEPHPYDDGYYGRSTEPPEPDYAYPRSQQERPPTRPPKRVGRDEPYPPKSASDPHPEHTTVPCKCGETIVVTEPNRPIRITCPRCGRRGILEGKKRSPEDEIFY